MAIDIKKLREEIKNSSTSKNKIIFFKEGTVRRLRFLDDFPDGYEIPWHSRWEGRIDCPCQEIYGRECEYCNDESIGIKMKYAWSVYDCEEKEVKILLVFGNRCSPAQVLAEAYEKYGTLKDREYEVKQLGSGTSKTFSIFPGEKRKMKSNIKPLSEKAILKYIDKAFPAGDGYNEDEEVEKEYKKTERERDKRISVKGKMNEPEEWEDEEDETNYEDMKPFDLYKECVKREIDCAKKKSKQYYIDLLEQYDDEKENDNWEDEPDEWEDDELPFN